MSGVAASERSWAARPWAARAIRIVVVLAPLAMGCAAAIVANRLIPRPSTAPAAIGRGLGLVALSTAVVWACDRYARKLLPLAALMQLSLVFPDHAPSRFKSALKSGSSRRLERAVDDARTNGLALDPGDAARQVVELIGAIGDHDRRTRGHSERVRLYADLVGEELKLSTEERQKLQWGALLHDLGKLMVPAEILNKAGKPSDEEWRILQGHPAAGMELIAPLRDFLGEWVHAIGGHHEKWDGSGYPAGLAGARIPRAAAIVAVADSFEVMTAVRSYKKAMPLADARAELTRCAGTHFSPEVVRAFLSISLGHLRLVSGPLAALAHIPFLGNLTQLPAAATAAVPAVASAAAVPAAAVVTAAALAMGPTPKVDALEQVAADAPATAFAAADATGSSDQPVAVDAAVEGTTTTAVPGAPVTTPSGETVVTTPGAGVAGTTPTTTEAPAAGATTTTAVVVAAPVTAAPTTKAPVTVPPTTAPVVTLPATTVPPTTVLPSTTTIPAGAPFTIQVANNNLRLFAQNLNGASFSRSSTIYVYAPISAKEVRWTYPGGDVKRTSSPFDMMGTGLLTANGFRLPSTPGTYTITAEAKNSGQGNGTQTVVATFTVT